MLHLEYYRDKTNNSEHEDFPHHFAQVNLHDTARRLRSKANQPDARRASQVLFPKVKKAVVICAVSVAVAVTLLYLNPPKSWDAVEVPACLIQVKR